MFYKLLVVARDLVRLVEYQHEVSRADLALMETMVALKGADLHSECLDGMFEHDWSVLGGYKTSWDSQGMCMVIFLLRTLAVFLWAWQ